ncbi:MAG: hypothetical protein WC494_01190 [Candidatus Pacearchaeota archaeon]
MAVVGFSTGCFYRAGLSVEQAVDFYRDLGAKSVEISFATPGELRAKNRRILDIRDILRTFERVTFHAPFKGILYSETSVNTNSVIMSFGGFCRKIPNYGVVIHPDIIEDFGRLKDSGISFLLENMDSRKTYGTLPEHFEKLAKYGFGYVLDLHHAYQVDPSMETARRLRDVMGERLVQFHVSGDSKGKHAPLHLAENRKKIEEILRENPSVPIILEGEMDKEETARRELEYVCGI